MSKKSNLTDFQETFCILYSRTGNALQSYKDAFGIKTNSAAARNSHTIRQRPYIVKRLEELRLEKIKKFDIGKEKIIKEHAKMAFMDLNEHFELDDDNNLKPKPDIDLNALDGVSFASASSESKDGSSFSKSWSVKLPQKIKALQELAKLNGFYDEEKVKDDNQMETAQKLLESLQKFKNNKNEQ